MDCELASIIRFVLDAAPEGAAAYYYRVKQGFRTPGIFFPAPEFMTSGDTLSSYRLEYSWYIVVFGQDDAEAYAIAHGIADALMRSHALVPLVDGNGEYTGEGLRLREPRVELIDRESAGGTAQLTLRWNSYRPYYERDVQKMEEFILNYTHDG